MIVGDVYCKRGHSARHRRTHSNGRGTYCQLCHNEAKRRARSRFPKRTCTACGKARGHVEHDGPCRACKAAEVGGTLG